MKYIKNPYALPTFALQEKYTPNLEEEIWSDFPEIQEPEIAFSIVYLTKGLCHPLLTSKRIVFLRADRPFYSSWTLFLDIELILLKTRRERGNLTIWTNRGYRQKQCILCKFNKNMAKCREGEKKEGEKRKMEEEKK